MTASIPEALPQWGGLVEQEAKNHGVDASLVLSILWQESSGNPTAMREEPRFIWFFSPVLGPLRNARLTVEQNRAKALTLLGKEEFAFQSWSHGLMQVMGSVAREFGYEGTAQPFYNPQTNISYGCRYLAVCLRRANGDLRRGLLRWNGGGNQQYDDEVLEKLEVLKAIEI